MNKAVVDCSTGEQTTVPLTEEEQQVYSVRQETKAAATAAAEIAAATTTTTRDADVALVRERAKTDADFAALARLAGIEIPETPKEAPPP